MLASCSQTVAKRVDAGSGRRMLAELEGRFLLERGRALDVRGQWRIGASNTF